MKRTIFALVLALFMISGCSVLDFFAGTSANANTHITTGDYEGVIFTGANTAQAGLNYEFNDPIVSYWTPTEAQISELETGLVPFLKATLTPDNYAYGMIDKLDGYKRQYFGVTFADGQPLIYTNFFCVNDFDNWQESLIFVMDGGECFFQVLYNPTNTTFSNLQINGFA
ncbi:MAG: hypothetical protein ABI690_25185 [Chloroflexota bacterium]